MGAAPEMDQAEVNTAGADAFFENGGDQTIQSDEEGNPVPGDGKDTMFADAGMIENLSLIHI